MWYPMCRENTLRNYILKAERVKGLKWKGSFTQRIKILIPEACKKSYVYTHI